MKKQDIHDFNIAELDIRIIFEGDGKNNISLIPSFSPFITNESKGERLFTFTVLDELEPIAEDKLDNIRNFDTGNGDTNVDKIIDGGYQFRFKTDREWNPKPRLIGKIRNIYKVFDTKTKEERVYDSERKFAAAEGIPYPRLRFWKKEDRKTFGDIEWTMEQVTYEMKYKFDKLRNKASR